MAEEITINDLTKQELLDLIIDRHLNHSINTRDIERVRWNTMVRKAKAMMDEARAEIEANTGKLDYLARTNYMLAHKKFNKAMELYAEADKFIGKP